MFSSGAKWIFADECEKFPSIEKIFWGEVSIVN